MYTITLETSNPSNEATVQYYVCYGYYDKSVTDEPITAKILKIYGKTKIGDRLLSQTENDAIEFIDVYDFEKECLLHNNVVEKTVNDFLERARIEEDKY